MRAALCLSLALSASTVVACGGTSSETPWPVEPDEQPLGPSAESNAPPAVTDPGPAPEEDMPADEPDAGAAARKQPPRER